MAHKRWISRIRAGNGQFNNEDHHDSHEFVQWLIDEMDMNVREDYKHFLRHLLKSGEYTKDRVELIQKIFGNQNQAK